ncbi:Chloroperoxidase [Aspergillus unguis]
MKLAFIQTILGLAAASCPNNHEQHKWQKPGPADSRSPCTGLNTLANHGFLPRNGRDIDLPTLHSAVSSAFNYAPDTFDGFFHAAVEFNLSTTGNASTFHLEDLKQHDAIEFDGSLSRNDIHFGDNLHFNHPIWASVAADLNLYDSGACEEDKYITVEVAAKARANRVREAMRVNPAFNNSENAMTASPGTTALYLVTMWDAKMGAAPKAWVKSFFEDERIPYIEGYQKPRHRRNFTDIIEMTDRVVAVDV